MYRSHTSTLNWVLNLLVPTLRIFFRIQITCDIASYALEITATHTVLNNIFTSCAFRI